MSDAPSKTVESPNGSTADTLRRSVFIIIVILCLTPFISAPVALLLGIIVAQVIGNPYSDIISKYKITPRLLQYSVVGLGFGMNIQSAVQAGKQGVLFTIITIIGTLVLGAILGLMMKTDKKTSHLISCGTAICGGSAIAAIAPVIRADEKQISVSLGIVFILNAIALFIFPVIGHELNLTEAQFGLWSAIAIHDTSSVVGAATAYGGSDTINYATTVKLARALWIIPLALITALFFKEGKQKTKIPYFIAFFILAMLINTYVPLVNTQSKLLVSIAKAGLVLTLFLIGAGLSMKTIKSVGIKPMLQGIILWIAIASVSLLVIINSVV
jgi:uncharacterized integral membrane protein (TIGR00698 family)